MSERGRIESADISDLVENAEEIFPHQGSTFAEAGCYCVGDLGPTTIGANCFQLPRDFKGPRLTVTYLV